MNKDTNRNQQLHEIILEKENQHILRLLGKAQIDELIAEVQRDYEKRIDKLLNDKRQS